MGLSACGVRAVGDTMTVDFMLEATSTLVEQAAKLRCVLTSKLLLENHDRVHHLLKFMLVQ